MPIRLVGAQRQLRPTLLLGKFQTENLSDRFMNDVWMMYFK